MRPFKMRFSDLDTSGARHCPHLLLSQAACCGTLHKLLVLSICDLIANVMCLSVFECFLTHSLWLEKQPIK